MKDQKSTAIDNSKKSVINYNKICKIFVAFVAVTFAIILTILLIFKSHFDIKEQKLITPLIITTAKNSKLDDYHRDLYKKINPFGFIVYSYSIKSFEQTKNFIAELRSIFPNRKLYIAIDQEGGSVDRLRSIAKEKNLQLLKSASYYGNIAKTDIARAKSEIYRDSKVTAKLLKELGFDINLAPMLDVDDSKISNNKDSRMYSSNHEIVYQLGLEFIKGMDYEGVMSTLKHLPGIGRSAKDTHDQASYISAPVEEIINKDIVPFQKLASSAKFGMVSHAIYQAIDDKPATTSKKVINFIKKESGFNGFLISDALNMKGVSPSMLSFNKVAKEVFLSGIDIIIPSCPDYFCSISALNAAIELGNLQQFNEKVRSLERSKD